MSERIEGTHSAEIEEALGALFAAPEPEPGFVAKLERKLVAEDKAITPQLATEASPLQRLRDIIWQPLRRHRWAAVGIAVLLVLAVALLAVGPQRVWADLQRLLGYVPGVGFVNLEETHVLTAPVSVTRDGVTLRVEQVLAQPDGTTVVISSEGLPPEDEVWPEGVEMDEGFKPRLRLSDGQTLEPDTFTLRWGAGTLEFPPLPDEVYRVTLELPSLPLVPAGVAAEDWEIPLTLRPATGEVVEDLFPQPYAPPDASDTHQGVTLRVLGVAHDPEETAVKLQLQWQDQDWEFFGVGATRLINLRDDLGHVYGEVIPPSAGSSSSSVVVAVPERSTPTPEPAIPTYETTRAFYPVSLSARELTLRVEDISFYIPADTSFSVDLGDDPQVGDYWPLDLHVQVRGFPVHIIGARLIEEEIGSGEGARRRTVLQFDVVRPREQEGRVLSAIYLDGKAAGFRAGSSGGGSPQAGIFHAGLEVEQGDPIPEGLIQLKVVHANLKLDESWEVTWRIPGSDEEAEAKPAPITLHPQESVEIDSGLSLALDKVVLTDRLTAIRVALDDAPGGVSLHHISDESPDQRHELALTDDRGRDYGEVWSYEISLEPYGEHESNLHVLSFEPLQPLARRLTLHIPGLTVVEPASATLHVTVPEGVTLSLDASDAPWPTSEPWAVDIPLQVGEHDLRFTEARLEEINGTTMLVLASEPYDASQRDRWLAGLHFGAVTGPDGSHVRLPEEQGGLVEGAFGSAGPVRQRPGHHQLALGFDVADPDTGLVQPGRYHVEIDGVRVLREGPWKLSWDLPAP